MLNFLTYLFKEIIEAEEVVWLMMALMGLSAVELPLVVVEFLPTKLLAKEVAEQVIIKGKGVTSVAGRPFLPLGGCAMLALVAKRVISSSLLFIR